jgi:hypothetical protein
MPAVIWTRQDQERAFELTQPVVCGSKHGTAFPIRVTVETVWYLTCAHVLSEWTDDKPAMVGGVRAEQVLSGGPVGLDLALLRIASKGPGRTAVDALPVFPLATPAHQCRIPGCHRPAELKSLLRDWIDATIDGDRTDPISPDGTLAMKGWRLTVADDGLLEHGYSGSPVICAETGQVFAVAVMRTDSGKGGIAICISNLARILPDELAGLFSPKEQSGLAEQVRTIFSDLGDRFDTGAVRDVVRRSAPEGTPLDWPAGDSASAYCTWLLNQLLFSNGRHPLYHVLEWIERNATGDDGRAQRVREAKQQLADLHRAHLNTEPLPEPKPTVTTQPALVEVVFQPLPAASFKDYAVHSYFHAGEGSGYESGPERAPTSGAEGTGRLDIHDLGQVVAFVQELTERRMALGFDPDACIFQFRVPLELMLHAFDEWPKNRLRQPLGRDYPVVIGAVERDWDGCERHWIGIQAGLDKPVRERVACCHPDESPLHDDAAVQRFLACLRDTPCIVPDRVPDTPDPNALTHLWVLTQVGVAAVWPRIRATEDDLFVSLDACLGALPLAQLPFAVRDLRRASAGQPDTPAARHRMSLFWDDPHRSAKRPGARPRQFLPGFRS